MNNPVHCSVVLVGAAAILISGPSGSGKSTLGFALVQYANLSGRLGCWIGDDYCHLETNNNRLCARPAQEITGKAEMRGIGIVKIPFEKEAVIRLVVDISTDELYKRLPECNDNFTDRFGTSVLRMAVPEARIDLAVMMVFQRLRESGWWNIGGGRII